MGRGHSGKGKRGGSKWNRHTGIRAGDKGWKNRKNKDVKDKKKKNQRRK